MAEAATNRTSAIFLADRPMSIVSGIPLSEEEGIGALTLGGYLRDVTSRFASREAAVMRAGTGTERWSYADLWERSMEVARALVACGAGHGARVGILATNRLEFLSCTFGTALAGGVATCFSTFSTPSELDFLLKASACDVLLFESRVLKKNFLQMLLNLEPAFASPGPGGLASTRYPFLRVAAMIDSAESVGSIAGWQAFLDRGRATDSGQVEARAAAVSPADPGVLLFSSGSTGKPKGILSAHRGVCLQLWRWHRWYNVVEPPRTWSANGFFWSGNFAMAFGSTLSSGGSLVLQRWFDADEALELIEAEKVTMIRAWPHQWAQLVAARNWGDVDLSSLHYVDRDSPIAKHPTISTDWQDPNQAYGNTETFTLISACATASEEAAAGTGHGLPTAGSTIKIVDPMAGNVLPLGERGEIAVKGPTLMLGYLGIPLADSLDPEGFLRTGDGGYLDELGHLHWEGRLNDIIKTGGANVSPLEIDDVIRRHPGVKLCQTVGVPDELLGEMVVSCVIPHAASELDEAAIQAFARVELASYKTPRRVIFFDEGELSLTGSAKIKADDLRKLARARLTS